MRVVTNHRPIVHFLGDKTRVVENKRLNNLRRKCEDFQFTTHYGKGSDNLADAISRIESWSEKDKDRFPTVSDHEDEGFRINSTQIQQCSVSRRTEGEFRMMKAALTKQIREAQGTKPCGNNKDSRRILDYLPKTAQNTTRRLRRAARITQTDNRPPQLYCRVRQRKKQENQRRTQGFGQMLLHTRVWKKEKKTSGGPN